MAARREVHRLFNRAMNDIVYKTYASMSQPISAIRMEAEQILDKAVNSYNPTFANKPMTYLRGYVEKKLNRYVGNNAYPVRVVEKYSTKMGKYKDSLNYLSNELGRDPSDDEVLTHMKKTYPGAVQDMRIKDIQRLKRDIRTTTFASNTVGRSDEGSSLVMEDMTFIEGSSNPMEEYLNDMKAMEIRSKVDTLPEPHKTIIRHTYGFPGYPKLSLRDLALKLGINKYRVQEYLKEAEAMLK